MSTPKVLYGKCEFVLDVTELAITNFLDSENKLFIPMGDHQRALIFSDPIFGVSKSIFINETEYTHDTDVSITDFIPSKPAKEIIKQINKK